MNPVVGIQCEVWHVERVAIDRHEVVRPRLRGVFHRYAAAAFAGAVGMLSFSVSGVAARAWVGIYGVCVTAMLGVSAVYHSRAWAPRQAQTLKRLDHSTILVAIAGSYTAVAGLALHGTSRTVLLVSVWVLAVIGVAIRMVWLDAPYPLTAGVYVVVGWVALVELGALVAALTTVELVLIVLGGVVYSLGAIVYALHRPNPWPDTFGYHEVFHALVVVAVLMHLVAVTMLAGR